MKIRRRNIEDCDNVTLGKGYCRTREFKDVHALMDWECNCGHTWKSSLHNIELGRWCRACAGLLKKTIEQCQQLATSRSGMFLSTEYINSKTKYIWQCKLKHVWSATYNDIGYGKWCPYCAGKRLKTIEDCHVLAKERGFSCLSNIYVNSRQKLIWKCNKDGHVWETSYGHVKFGNGCSRCSTKKSGPESEIYKTIKERWPDAMSRVFSMLPSKHLELDVYIPCLKIAIEYDGPYHFKPIRGEEELKRQQKADLRKNAQCEAVGIKLIRINGGIFVKDLTNIKERVLNLIENPPQQSLIYV